MKILVLGIFIVITSLLSSCASTENCPNYQTSTEYEKEVSL